MQLGCVDRRRADSDHHVHPQRHQLRRQGWEPLVDAPGPARFDADVLALDQTAVAQAVLERDIKKLRRRRAVQDADARNT
jgi:hypothetical protein